MLNRKHWLMRAEHARTTASWMEDRGARRLLIEIAERYQRLAEMPKAYAMGRHPVKESPPVGEASGRRDGRRSQGVADRGAKLRAG